MNVLAKLGHVLLWSATLVAMPVLAAKVDETEMGEAVERHLPGDEPLMLWVQDPEDTAAEQGDTIETRETLEDAYETVKLSGSAGQASCCAVR
jgi:hypothetical protein